MKVKMNWNRTNTIACISAVVFYVAYCFVGWCPDLPVSLFQYWINSALFLDGKMVIVLAICLLPYVKTFIEGTYLNNRSVMTLLK